MGKQRDGRIGPITRRALAAADLGHLREFVERVRQTARLSLNSFYECKIVGMLKQIVLFAACCLILAALVAVANTDLNFLIVIPALFIAGY